MKAKLISATGELVKEIELHKTIPSPMVYIDGETNIMYMLGATGNGCWEYNAIPYYIMGTKSESLINCEGEVVA